MHKEIQIAPGVYVTDFRVNGQLKGIDTQTPAQAKDVGLLIDKISANQSKITQLMYSIQAIKQQQDWSTDNVLLEAIEQNYGLTLKFSSEMKQWILQINALNYKPENDKIQELLDANRIEKREAQIVEQFNMYLKYYGVPKKDENSENKVLVEVSDEDEKQKDKKENNEKGKKEIVADQSQGIYL